MDYHSADYLASEAIVASASLSDCHTEHKSSINSPSIAPNSHQTNDLTLNVALKSFHLDPVASKMSMEASMGGKVALEAGRSNHAPFSTCPSTSVQSMTSNTHGNLSIDSLAHNTSPIDATLTDIKIHSTTKGPPRTKEKTPSCRCHCPRWMGSKTLRTFIRYILLCGFVMLPGVLLYFFPLIESIGNVEPLLWFATISSTLMVFPISQLVLHVILYHCIPEQLYLRHRLGNFLFHLMETSWFLSCATTLLFGFVGWNLVVPSISSTNTDLYIQSSLPIINCIIGSMMLWVGSFWIKRVIILNIICQFNQSAFLERLREVTPSFSCIPWVLCSF